MKTLSDINVNDDIYAEAFVENKSGESGKIILTLALYNGDLLQSVIQANKEFYNNASDIVSTSNSKVKITNKTDLSIKTFVWGENLAPKCVPVLIGHQ